MLSPAAFELSWFVSENRHRGSAVSVWQKRSRGIYREQGLEQDTDLKQVKVLFQQYNIVYGRSKVRHAAHTRAIPGASLHGLQIIRGYRHLLGSPKRSRTKKKSN